METPETPGIPSADEPFDIEEFERWAQAAEAEEQSQATEAEVHTLYERSLLHLQEGRWQEAANGLEEVLRLRPDHADAAALLEEARLKASLEAEKPTPRRALPRLPVRRILMIVVPIAAVALVVLGVREAYGRWVQPAQAAQEENERRTAQLQAAYTLWAERDYLAAEDAFRAYLAEYPDTPEAEDVLARIEERMTLQATYAKVAPALASRDWPAARSLLTEIIARDARYRDAQELLIFVDEQEELDTWFDTAEQAFAEGAWLEAIAAYETLIGLDDEHQSDLVSEHLFESYLYQGRALVQDTSGEGEAVREALDWLGKALELQPQHQRALYEHALAKRYLQGRTLLARGELDAAVDELQWVYQQEPDYAGGVVALILKAATEEEHEPKPEVAPDLSAPQLPEGSFEERFASYMQEGDEAMAVGDYALAETEYREATAVAVHGGVDAGKWLFSSFAKLGAALAGQEKNSEAVEALKKAIVAMGMSATAIPSDSYAAYVEEGDRFADSGDHAGALEQYAQAIQIMGEKCDCGLEDWSVLP
jgi:tetratricopeptide (TPR) repeat protein